MSNTGYKSITRLDSVKPDQKGRVRSRKGWYVKVRFKGQNYAKFFSDTDYPNHKSGLRAAVRWRDKVEKDLGKPRTERIVVALNPFNNTGVIGIRRATRRSQESGNGHKRLAFYDITWRPEPNKMTRTSVSIDRWGEVEAWRRALALRRKIERQVYGGTWAPKLEQPLSKSNGRRKSAPTG